MDPCRHSTTQSNWRFMMKLKFPYSWSPQWRTCMLPSSGFRVQTSQPPNFFGWPYINRTKKLQLNKIVFSYPKTPSDSPGLDPRRQARQTEKGVCILNTLEFLQCDFELPGNMSPKAAGKPVSILEFFDPGNKNQTIPIHRPPKNQSNNVDKSWSRNWEHWLDWVFSKILRDKTFHEGQSYAQYFPDDLIG